MSGHAKTWFIHVAEEKMTLCILVIPDSIISTDLSTCGRFDTKEEPVKLGLPCDMVLLCRPSCFVGKALISSCSSMNP